MAASTPAYVNYRMLVWARETAGMDLTTVGRRLQVTANRIAAWECGDSLPTMRQARMLASLYKRPLSLFYFDDPPAEPPRPTDFRIAAALKDVLLPPSLRFAMRDAYNRRLDALRLLKGLGQQPKSVRLRASLDESAEIVGERLRKWTKVTIREQQKCGSPREFYNLLRTRFEHGGVLTFQMSDVPEKTATGFSFAESPLPAISVNNKTNPVRRLFTLFHELAHIALRQGGLCELSRIDHDSPKQHTEAFCNRVAGAALVPRDAVLSHPIVKGHTDYRYWDQSQINELAAELCVSRYVMLIRLRAVNKAAETFCRQRLSEYGKQEEREAAAAPFVLVHDRVASVNGQFFSRLVLDSYFNQQLSLRDVSDLLNLNLEYLDRLADKVYREAS